MKKLLKITLLSLLMTSVHAQEKESDEKDEETTGRASVGYGLALKKNNREGNTYEDADKNTIAKAFPLVQFSYGRFSLGGQGLAFRLTGTEREGFSLIANLGGERYEAPGMVGRKKSLFVGGLYKWNKYSLMASHDVSAKSKGTDAQFSYNEVYFITKGLLARASAFVEFHDKNYNQYYYGVNATEATATRAQTNLKGSFTPGVGGMLISQIVPRFSLLTGLNFKLISKKIQDSPTVKDQPLDVGGFIGFNYRL